MTLVPLSPNTPLPQPDPRLVDAAALEHDLKAALEGEVRFDQVSRALYSTDASVYQIEPSAWSFRARAKTSSRVVDICAHFRCPLTMRGGGTSQAGQAIGAA
jgi:FAD/FMN-containing dehydrogenase